MSFSPVISIIKSSNFPRSTLYKRYRSVLIDKALRFLKKYEMIMLWVFPYATYQISNGSSIAHRKTTIM